MRAGHTILLVDLSVSELHIKQQLNNSIYKISNKRARSDASTLLQPYQGYSHDKQYITWLIEVRIYNVLPCIWKFRTEHTN
jgi:hypothetical protein